MQFFVVLQPDSILSEADVLDIRQGKYFVHFYGFAIYQNVFGRTHRVQLHLRWTMRFGGVIEGQITEWWQPVGKPEENSDVEEPKSTKSNWELIVEEFLKTFPTN